MKIAVVGQGFVGGAYSTWLEERGHDVIRYGLESQFAGNRDRVREAELVLVAVPTPTTPDGQDLSAVRGVVGLADSDATIVVKSTVLPGTTDDIAAGRSGPTVHSPEFLRADHALADVRNPSRMVFGFPDGHDRQVTDALMALCPGGDVYVTAARTSEFAKYAANAMLTAKVVMANALFDALPDGSSWGAVEKILATDPRIGPSHMTPVDANGGRGAGGHCFIKDLAALAEWSGVPFLQQLEDENLGLLEASGKDADIVAAVYRRRRAA